MALVTRNVPAGRRFGELPTGSRISWVRVPAEGPRRPTSGGGHRRLVALTAMAATISTAITKMTRTAGSTRPPQVPMATGRPATARSRAVIPAQPGVGAAAAGE